MAATVCSQWAASEPSAVFIEVASSTRLATAPPCRSSFRAGAAAGFSGWDGVSVCVPPQAHRAAVRHRAVRRVGNISFSFRIVRNTVQIIFRPSEKIVSDGLIHFKSAGKLAGNQFFHRRQVVADAQDEVAQQFGRGGFVGEEFDHRVGAVIERAGVELVFSIASKIGRASCRERV